MKCNECGKIGRHHLFCSNKPRLKIVPVQFLQKYILEQTIFNKTQNIGGYVTINQGVGYVIPKGNPYNINILATEGLSGCSALMIKIVEDDKLIIFMIHLDADLYYKKYDKLFQIILNTSLELINKMTNQKINWNDFKRDSDKELYLVSSEINEKLVVKLQEYLKVQQAYGYIISACKIAFKICNNSVYVTIPSTTEIKQKVKTEYVFNFPNVEKANIPILTFSTKKSRKRRSNKKSRKRRSNKKSRKRLSNKKSRKRLSNKKSRKRLSNKKEKTT